MGLGEPAKEADGALQSAKFWLDMTVEGGVRLVRTLAGGLKLVGFGFRGSPSRCVIGTGWGDGSG